MSLIVVLTIGQAVSSTLAWIGFYAGIRALPDGRARQSRWIIGSAGSVACWGSARCRSSAARPRAVPEAPDFLRFQICGISLVVRRRSTRTAGRLRAAGPRTLAAARAARLAGCSIWRI